MSIYYVRKTGNDANGGTNPDTDAKLTIASAVSVSQNNDTIDIGEGTFDEPLGNVSRTFQGAGMYKTYINDPSLDLRWGGLTITHKNLFWRLTGSFSAYGITPYRWTADHVLYDFESSQNYMAHICYFPSETPIHTFRNVIFNGGPRTDGTIGYFWRVGNANITIDIDNCVFYRMCKSFDIYNYGGFSPNISVRNSIFYNARTGNAAGYATSWGKEEYNCWYFSNGNITSTISDTSIKNKNPLFVDAAGYDFRLMSESPCIGAGHV